MFKKFGFFFFFSLKQQKFILSLFRRQEVWNQGVNRVGSHWWFWGRICPTPFFQLLVVVYSLWCSLAYGCIDSVSARVSIWPCFLCLCVSFSQFGSFLKIKHKFTIWPRNILQIIYPKEMKTQVNTETCIQMLIILLFIIT